ncbi:hypothetical protein AK914_11040 [Listeria monocytogenes]|uniref:Uncharacterized protein n=1 Tax=Listeria monocytogenes TaxID=1639 RepID=A0AAN2WEC7_LISMN|nr:hypothetical protein [Listeria monocytogenes]EAC8547233.1 hypothetical protein [Listeria monocytogenes]EAC8933706.1 hypothetical protein [Listeria monocytogenes]EAD0855118.1 hypothetical protein [Listeria monocytogenes]EAD8894411.1 hypothetical protein [Listeria monocytogenes]
MKHGQWMLNGTDGDRWEACEYFDTKEEAIFYGIELLTEYNSLDDDERRDYDLSDGLNMRPLDYENIYTFFVGQIEEVRFPNEVDTLLEIIAERIYAEVGEYAEGYLDDVTQEHKEQLSDLIYEWAKQRDYLPSCFTIEMAEEIDIRSFEEVAE